MDASGQSVLRWRTSPIDPLQGTCTTALVSIAADAYIAGVGRRYLGFEMWTPMERWMPQQFMHRKTPRLSEAQSGSAAGDDGKSSYERRESHGAGRTLGSTIGTTIVPRECKDYLELHVAFLEAEHVALGIGLGCCLAHGWLHCGLRLVPAEMMTIGLTRSRCTEFALVRRVEVSNRSFSPSMSCTHALASSADPAL